MTASNLSLTVVVPCYNEAARFDQAAFQEYLARDRHTSFLFVDDGSSDTTLEVLHRLRDCALDRVEVLSLPKNVGKGEAVRRGLCAAAVSGPAFLGYWDADLATPLEAIPELREQLEGDENCLIVLGSRVRLLGRSIERSPVRHYLGRVFATLVSLLLSLPVYDTQCGAKLLRNDQRVVSALGRPFGTRWVFDVELMARLLTEEGAGENSLVEFPLRCWKDVKGSKVRWYDFLLAGKDLLKLYAGYYGRRDRATTES